MARKIVRLGPRGGRRWYLVDPNSVRHFNGSRKAGGSPYFWSVIGRSVKGFAGSARRPSVRRAAVRKSAWW